MPWIPLGGPGSTWQPYGGGSPPPGGPKGVISGVGSLSGRGSISNPVSDPLSAALKKTFDSPSGSFFPVAQQMVQNDRQDLLKEAENTFYGGGNAQPTPTPTPAPVKPHQLTLEQLYDHFGVDNPVRVAGNYGRPLYQNQPDTQVWKTQYGYPS